MRTAPPTGAARYGTALEWSVQKALVALRIEPPPNAGLTRMAANPDGSFTFGEPLAAR